MKRFIKLTLIIAFVLSVISISSAQEQDTISPEKRKLIAELLVLTKTGAQVVQITDSMLDSMERTYPIIIKQTLDSDGQLSKVDQDKLSARLAASYRSFSKKFRERLPKEIDYAQFVEDMVYPLYNKYFTEKELADLIAFYKTETGQKIVTAMPVLFAESTKLSETLLVPKLMKLVDEIIKEEINTFEEDLAKDEG